MRELKQAGLNNKENIFSTEDKIHLPTGIIYGRTIQSYFQSFAG